MARARNIKPGFFTNDVLAEIDPLGRILFQGLWCNADREGRLEDRPKKIKAEVLPYDNCDADNLLNQLQDKGFIRRYEVGGVRYLQVINFAKHQNPHVKEGASTIPAEGESGSIPIEHQTSTVQVQCKHQESSEQAGLIPDSLNLIPDSPIRIPDSLHSGAAAKVSAQKTAVVPVAIAPVQKQESELQLQCRMVWRSYSEAYLNRYGVEPVRNAKVNSNVKQFVQRLGADDAPPVAGFFLRHNDAFYVRKGHDFGMLLADAEKIRMEWASQRTVTATQAAQADRTQANREAANQALEILEAGAAA